MDTCPICSTAANIVHKDYNRKLRVDCRRCGEFIISYLALRNIPFSQYQNPTDVLSYWISNHKSSSQIIELRGDNIVNILENTKLPKAIEQSENLLRLIGKTLKSPSDSHEFDANFISSVIGAIGASGVKYIASYLNEQGYIKATIDTSDALKVSMTFKGWDRYDDICREPSKGNICFMAMKYGDAALDRVYNDHLRSAVAKTGFELRRLNENLKAGLIDDQLRVQIRRAKFLLADLTHANNGAYWEAGYAEGLGKPVIYLCRRDVFAKKKTHFDTNHLVTIIWKEETILEDMENLKATIRATFPNEAFLSD